LLFLCLASAKVTWITISIADPSEIPFDTATGEAGPSESNDPSLPSSIRTIWHNMCCTSDFGTVEAKLSCGPDRLFVEVAEHLREGLYHVVSTNISNSSLIVLCETERSLQDF
jgi:hypothetical protein